ncbi:MAG: phosphoglucosamine mutase [Pseudomonadota bacterium]
MRKKKYFGTDGIRGRVGQEPINAEFVLKLGWAAGRVLGQGSGKVLIGKDTRISGYMFESALEAGLSAAGVDVRLTGPMPTPAIAYLTRTLHARAGIVISASHNPYYDNGIKFFSAQGSKLPDEIELAIEAELDKPMQTVDSALLGKAERVDDAAGRYIEFCKSTIPAHIDLRGMKIVVDCAHGAAYHIAPNVFGELGADVMAIGVEPNGLNINDRCGATDLTVLRAAVLAHGAHLGIAVDGDGDRVLMVDQRGEIVDGDELLFIIAREQLQNNMLKGPVVGTVMSNLGLEHALYSLGAEFKRAPVGDRYVLELLQQSGGVLGGEASGHIICLNRTSTGDAIVAALQVLAVLAKSGRGLHEAKGGMSKYPQRLVNVRLHAPFNLSASQHVRAALREAEAQLAGQGRVLLRPSGTEPLVRVMVEGRDATQVEALAQHLAAAVSEAMAVAAGQ